MLCPICGKEMVYGYIHPFGIRTPFWLPDAISNAEIDDVLPLFLTAKSIENIGGRVIGTAANPLLRSVALDDSFLCENCNFVITKL